MTCKIRSVVEKSFPQSVVSLDHAPFGKDDLSRFTPEIYISTKDKEERPVVFLHEENTNFYAGVVEPEDVCQTMFLVKKPGSHKGILLPISTCALERANSRDDSIHSNWLEKSMREDLANPITSEKRRSTAKMLAESFGSKRSKRRSELNEKIYGTGNVKADEMVDVASKVDVKESEIQGATGASVDIETVLPPCDRDADDAKAIYSPKSILTADIRNEFADAVSIIMAHPPTSADDKTSFFLSSHIQRLKSKLTEERLTLLLYADCLVKLVKCKNRGALSRNKDLCPFSKTVHHQILNKFTIDNGKSYPDSMKDKTVCYIIVCILLVFNLLVDMETLCLSLSGFSSRKVVQLARTVGLSPVKGSKGVFKLQLPLPPLPSVFKKRNKN